MAGPPGIGKDQVVGVVGAQIERGGEWQDASDGPTSSPGNHRMLIDLLIRIANNPIKTPDRRYHVVQFPGRLTT